MLCEKVIVVNSHITCETSVLVLSRLKSSRKKILHGFDKENFFTHTYMSIKFPSHFFKQNFFSPLLDKRRYPLHECNKTFIIKAHRRASI